MYSFLDQPTNAQPVVPMPGTSKTAMPDVNLDSSRILDWFGSLPGMSHANAVIKESGNAKPAAPSQAPARGPSQVSGQVLKTKNPQLESVVTTDSNKKLEVTTVRNEGALREEIEIELVSCDGVKFTGSLTMQEAKHGIFRDCLGFKDFKNFDGVRFAFKGVRIVAFKLKEAINVDDLIDIQHFDYKRRIKKNNSNH